ncbi:Ig-like domain-containing protein [Sodalis sp. dw_96]|uniref:Ig-like domain-containing protein n=1 Tax=Sodalis sp. dw_96 TaxID=2719794 RepID=UPI001BD5D4DC|nr:Ig-like domain-containing protein [Sodalis sp. dw_96]
MALQPPILPQLINETITTARISADSGIKVYIPSYGNLRVDDIISIYFNSVLVVDYRITEVDVLPQQFLIPGNSAMLGNNIMQYTATDRVGNTTSSDPLPFTVVQSASVSDYVLSAQIIRNGANADGHDQNQIIYILSSLTGQSVSDKFITFAHYDSGGVNLSAPYGQTSNAGLFNLFITSSINENVLIVATLSSDNTVTNSEVLSFVEAPITYSLSATVVVNNQPANGQGYNLVVAKLVNSLTQAGIGGRSLQVYVGGAANYPNAVITNEMGEASIYISTTNPGSMNVIISLQSDYTVQTNLDINFIPSYPITFPPYEVWVGEYVPVSTLFGPIYFQQGHVYEVSLSRTYNFIWDCGVNYAHIYSGAGTICASGRPTDFLFLGDGFSYLKPLKTGSGADFYSRYAPYYNAANSGYTLVTVVDHGPTDSTFSIPAILGKQGNVLLEHSDNAESPNPAGNVTPEIAYEPTDYWV